MTRFFTTALLTALLMLPAYLVSAAPETEPRTATPAPAAVRTLDGYVLDADGLALPGVTARVAGSMTMVVSNADGMFRLPLPADGQPVRLVCSYAGLTDCVVVIGAKQRVLSLEMNEKAQLLSVPAKRRR